MPQHEVPKADTSLEYVPYLFCCKVKVYVELTNESCYHFVCSSMYQCW